MGPIHIKLAIANVLRQFTSTDPRCWVEEKVMIGYIHSKIHVDPAAGCDSFPVYMQFEANEPVDSVGFLPADDRGGITQYTKRGPCGGCFFLECDIDHNSKTTPLIRNDGPGDGEYRFEFQVGGKPIGFDPQIYNQGVGNWPRLRMLRCLLRKIFT
jgi:hypothetical protein